MQAAMTLGSDVHKVTTTSAAPVLLQLLSSSWPLLRCWRSCGYFPPPCHQLPRGMGCTPPQYTLSLLSPLMSDSPSATTLHFCCSCLTHRLTQPCGNVIDAAPYSLPSHDTRSNLLLTGAVAAGGLTPNCALPPLPLFDSSHMLLVL